MRPSEPPRLSVVIPTLNEASNIGGLLDHLAATAGIHEVVVADGGSKDGTQDVVREHGARLVESEAGRGQQLRAGAAVTTGDVLLFLHADVWPPPDLHAQISDALARSKVGGNFRLRYPGGGLLGWWLENLAVPLYRRLGRYYGDSGVFVRRDVYGRIGGMPYIPIMEDVVFVGRLEAAGETAYLPGPMISSPRRWEGRPLHTLLLWGFMQLAFSLGASPWQLVRFYRANKL
jgi:rSAM/selenodomain-associated transferase 2